MKFREIFRFELTYQFRSIATWLFVLLLGVVAALFVRGNFLADALYADFYVNSPFVIAITTVLTSMLWFVVAAPVAGRAGAYDVERRIDPLIYTSPLSRKEYLGGKFLASLLLNALILLAVPLGIILAVYLPGVPPEAIGPFRPATYLTTYCFIALPNAFIGTAVQFSWATLARRTIASYVGSLCLLFFAYGGMVVLGLFMHQNGLAALLDVFGNVFVTSEITAGWTPIEKNTRLIGLEGELLRSRIFWIAIACATLAVTYVRFRFAHHTSKGWRFWRTGRYAEAPTPSSEKSLRRREAIPHIEPSFTLTAQLHQIRAIVAASLQSIVRGRIGLLVPLVVGVLVVLFLPSNMANLGTPLLPRTEYVLSLLTAPLTRPLTPWVIIPLMIIFYAGELVWRERQAGLGEVTDALPVRQPIVVAGKFLALAIILAGWMVVLTLAGLLVQLRMGYPEFEIGLYLKVLFGLQLPQYLLFALLALVIQGVIHQKYVGHFAALLSYLFILFAPSLGIEHHLLIYGSAPAWSYTDMRGFGASLTPWRWFMLYWGAWSLILAVGGILFWNRGEETGGRVRLQIARHRFTRTPALMTATGVLLMVGVGSFIFYNTNVRHSFSSLDEKLQAHADYEKRYGRYSDSPQPQLLGADLKVELYPERQEGRVQGTYHLVNNHTLPLDTLYVATMPLVEMDEITFDRKVETVLIDEEVEQRIYRLDTPLLPGDSLQLRFSLHMAPDGFRNEGVNPSITPRSTLLWSLEILPAIGYQKSRELLKPVERRTYGLSSRPLLPTLDEAEASRDITGEGLRSGERGGIYVNTIIGTDDTQQAIAPGTLRRTWKERGRRYFHFGTVAPIGETYAFLSSNYLSRTEEWNDLSSDTDRTIGVEIYYSPKHDANIDRILRSIRASLDYYTSAFGPYPYDHIRVVESPGTGIGAHSEPTSINYSEGFSRFNVDDDPRGLDLPFGVMAHEMAHQWGVPYTYAEGATLITESFAWYGGLGVVKRAYGLEHLRRLLRFFRQPYPIPPIRQSVPLLRAADPYAAYRKGPFALYGLSQYMGEDRVNQAFRSLIAKHRSGLLPTGTSLDFYRELQLVTPDSLRYLIHDLFEANTFWQLATNKVSAREISGGMWQVKMEITARKVTVDPAGKETDVPMNEWIPIGVFAPGKPGSDFGESLYLKPHPIRSGTQTITVNVRQKPADAGIDPYHLLIDVEPFDNVERVKIEE